MDKSVLQKIGDQDLAQGDLGAAYGALSKPLQELKKALSEESLSSPDKNGVVPVSFISANNLKTEGAIAQNVEEEQKEFNAKEITNTVDESQKRPVNFEEQNSDDEGKDYEYSEYSEYSEESDDDDMLDYYEEDDDMIKAYADTIHDTKVEEKKRKFFLGQERIQRRMQNTNLPSPSILTYNVVLDLSGKGKTSFSTSALTSELVESYIGNSMFPKMVTIISTHNSVKCELIIPTRLMCYLINTMDDANKIRWEECIKLLAKGMDIESDQYHEKSVISVSDAMVDFYKDIIHEKEHDFLGIKDDTRYKVITDSCKDYCRDGQKMLLIRDHYDAQSLPSYNKQNRISNFAYYIAKMKFVFDGFGIPQVYFEIHDKMDMKEYYSKDVIIEANQKLYSIYNVFSELFCHVKTSFVISIGDNFLPICNEYLWEKSQDNLHSEGIDKNGFNIAQAEMEGYHKRLLKRIEKLPVKNIRFENERQELLSCFRQYFIRNMEDFLKERESSSNAKSKNNDAECSISFTTIQLCHSDTVQKETIHNMRFLSILEHKITFSVRVFHTVFDKVAVQSISDIIIPSVDVVLQNVFAPLENNVFTSLEKADASACLSSEVMLYLTEVHEDITLGYKLLRHSYDML